MAEAAVEVGAVEQAPVTPNVTEDVKNVSGEVSEKPQESVEIKDVLGFDLGSSKICVALLSSNETFPQTIRNELSNRTTPATIVFAADGSRLIGEPAELVKTRGGAITDVKSRIRSGDRATVTFHGAPVTLHNEHLAAMLFSRVGGDIERHAKDNLQGRALKRAVLCVSPAISNENVRSIRDAAVLSGLDVQSVVWDISCVSLMYAHRSTSAIKAEKEKQAKAKKGSKPTLQSEEEVAQHVLFVDVGHEYASAQVVHVDPANSAIKILATKSRGGCGGGAFANVLVQIWVELLRQKHKVDVETLSPAAKDRALGRLGHQAGKTSAVLSGLPEAEVVVESVVPDLDLRTRVTRTELEQKAQPVLQNLQDLLKSTIAEAGLTEADIKRVELVGGGSRIPVIQNTIKSAVLAPSKTLDNECTQSFGAAIFGGIHDGFVSYKVEGSYGPSDVNAVAGLPEESLEKIRALEKEMHEDDLAVTAKNDAKNLLEKFVFDIRREASEITVGVDDEESLDKLRSLLSNAESWIYEDGETSNASQILEKLESVRKESAEVAPKLFDILAKREEKQRKERLEAAQQEFVPKQEKKKVMRPAEKIVDAKSKKEHGNQLIRDNNFEDATRRYTQALGICGEMDGTLNPTDQAEVNEIKLSCYLNLSFCNVKLKLPKLAVNNATKAIELSPDKPRGYFRRAQAYFETKDFDLAKKDLQAAAKLDAEDKAISSLLTKVDQCLELEKKKQQKMYSKMFG